MATRSVLGALLVALLLGAGLPGQPPLQQKVMITEVCPYGTEAVELTNYDTLPFDLTGYRVKWKSSGVTLTSSPLNVALAPREILVVRDANGGSVDLNIPGNVGQLLILPAVTVPFGVSVTVGLV